MNARAPFPLLHLVDTTGPRPRQRPISMDRAAKLFPDVVQRIAWLRAVAFLRTRTSHGWLYDRLPHDTNEEPPQ